MPIPSKRSMRLADDLHRRADPLVRMRMAQGVCARTVRAGFTLVEFITVVAIVLIVSTIILIGYGNFRSGILLSSLAYDVALTIRTAQTYGLGAREAEINNGDFDTGYGIRFNSNTPDMYLLFADFNQNLRYDDGELVQTYTLGRGFVIADVCAVSGSSDDCDVDFVDIAFERPNPDAHIRSNTGSGYAAARVTVSVVQGEERYVTTTASGQITVQQ